MKISVIITIVFFIALVMWIHPRVTTYADRRLALPRCTTSHNRTSTPSCENQSFTDTQDVRPHFSTPVDAVEELLRLTRTGVHAKDAIETVLSHLPLMPPHIASRSISTHSSLQDRLLMHAHACHQTHRREEALMYRMLTSSFVHGAFIPAALEHVLATLRTHQSMSADIRSASAQALFTSRILTYLPLVAFTILLLASPDIRSRLLQVSIVTVLAVGLALNRLGAMWISRHITHTVRRPTEETVILTEHLATSLRAGCSLTESLQRWEHITPAGTAVAQSISQGARIDTALKNLPHTSAGYRLSQTIVSGHNDGLPLVHTMHRLIDDAHNDMRSATDILIRQLPSRLSAPLVLCILPSFLLIAVLPLALHSLGQLGPVLTTTS
jgi:tight adherence protein B